MIVFRRIHEPSLYKAAPKKLLDRPSTMQDVAEFFMEYINSDVRTIFHACSSQLTDISYTDSRDGGHQLAHHR
jgi:hypothetical protein